MRLGKRLPSAWQKTIVEYGQLDDIQKMASAALSTTTNQIIPIGVSMGGIVALEMWRMAAHRISALVLVDTNPYADTSARYQARQEQVEFARKHGMAALADTYLIPSYFPSSLLVKDDHHAAQQCVRRMACDSNVDDFAAQSAALASRRDGWSLLPSIAVPTLIMCGEYDQICPPESHIKMADLIPTSTLQIVANTAHLPPLESPDVISDLLANWITSIDGHLQ